MLDEPRDFPPNRGRQQIVLATFPDATKTVVGVTMTPSRRRVPQSHPAARDAASSPRSSFARS